MFDEKRSYSEEREDKPGPAEIGPGAPSWWDRRIEGIPYVKILFFTGSALAVVFLLGQGFLYWNQKKLAGQNDVHPGPTDQQPATGTASGFLPVWDNGENNDHNKYDQYGNLLQAETMVFGDFYEAIPDIAIFAANDYELPLNAKADVINYYDVNRKIDLDQALESLNSSGFAFIGNPFPAQDHFSIYRELLGREIPALVTSDFLVYTFQNILKEAYNEIEQNAYFESVWSLYKELYQTALARFRSESFDSGYESDVLLEAMRMETAFLATVLHLLSPFEKQINRQEKFSDPNKFSSQEAEYYRIELPVAIKEQVEKEVDLIRQAKQVDRSPILLYGIDYRIFALPPELKDNAKLSNFYQVKKWLNSVFPLHHKDSQCPDCLLDYEDWMISLAAAAFLTQDIGSEQKIKNRWANIYKVVAFFSGLRQDLTYLHFQEVLRREFGDDYDLTDIFRTDSDRPDRLLRLQEGLVAVEFTTIEGSQDRHDQAIKPNLGFRVLQEPYWPNDYLFDRLTGEDMSLAADFFGSRNQPITACKAGTYVGYYRCRGFGMDIIKLLAPRAAENDYYIANSNYHGYSEKMAELRTELDRFDHNSWNSNMYWSSLDLAGLILREDRSNMPLVMRSSEWLRQRETKLALSTWVNIHLPPDILGGHSDNAGMSLGAFIGCNQYSVVEPDIGLIGEILAKVEMLNQALEFLGLGPKSNTASVGIKEYHNKMSSIKKIAEKQINGQALNEEDCRDIKDLTTSRRVVRAAPKTFHIASEGKNISESIAELELLLMIYQGADGKNILAVGPVYRYFEE